MNVATTLDNENNKSSPGVNKILNTIAAIGTQDEYKKKTIYKSNVLGYLTLFLVD